ncbi:MAG: hypothetical protein ACI4HN_00140 [Ruminococcus sp.]
MAGRHSAKSSKKPLVIICIVVAVIIIGVVCAVIILNSGSKPANTNSTTTNSTTTQQTTSTVQSSSSESAETTLQPTEAEEPTTQAETFTGETSEVPKVVVPTQSGQEVSYFNATYVPYKAIDSSTNEECSLREVFGSAFSQGVITFNSDGTFTDSVTTSSVDSGAYAVDGDTISATYSNDKNMSVKVASWEGDTPSELIINYGGYDVYFNM